MYITDSIPKQEILLHFADKNMQSALNTPCVRVGISLQAQKMASSEKQRVMKLFIIKITTCLNSNRIPSLSSQ